MHLKSIKLKLFHCKKKTIFTLYYKVKVYAFVYVSIKDLVPLGKFLGPIKDLVPLGKFLGSITDF